MVEHPVEREAEPVRMVERPVEREAEPVKMVVRPVDREAEPAAEAFSRRFSLCCGRDGCRHRATPPSVRFLGGRVYVGAVVIVRWLEGTGGDEVRADNMAQRLEQRYAAPTKRYASCATRSVLAASHTPAATHPFAVASHAARLARQALVDSGVSESVAAASLADVVRPHLVCPDLDALQHKVTNDELDF